MAHLHLSKTLEAEIQAGLSGLNDGLPMGLNRLSDELCGVQRRRYDLIGGDIGSGKTAFLDTCYVLNPYDYLLKNPQNQIKLKILYFSLEIGRVAKITKLMARKIFMDYGVVIPTREILSKGANNRLSQDKLDLIRGSYKYFDTMEDNVLTFRDESITPGKFYHIVKEYSESHGTWVDDPARTTIGEDGKVYKAKNYIPKDPNTIHLIIMDHMGLTNESPKKQAIEKISQYAVWFRNKCGFSFTFVQQYNRSLQSADRTKLQMLEPRMSDFKETAGTQEDAETIIALFSPNRYKVPDFYGFNVNTLRNRLRAAYILKNRDGDEGLHIPLNFFGETGYFREFPKYDPNIGVPHDFMVTGLDPYASFSSTSIPGVSGYGMNTNNY